MMRLEVEEAALKQETDDASEARLSDVQKTLADVKEKVNGLTARWEDEKQALDALSAKKTELDKLPVN